MIKAIFFDFDMTLVDSGPIAKESYRALLKYTRKKPTQKGFDDYVGRRVSESISALAKTEAEKKEMLRIFLKIHEHKITKLKVYGRYALKYLKRKKIKVVIVSNNANEVIEKTCRAHNLHFDKIIADDELKIGEKKHQAIKREIKKLNLKKEEAFYVGDHINDIKEGKKAGIRVVSVTTGVFSKEQLAKYKPYAIIKDLNELKDML